MIGAQLLSNHNIAHQFNLMRDARNAIKSATFANFVTTFMIQKYGGLLSLIPHWIVDSLHFVGISFPSNS
jgi:queuine/archaeosine tRNA-ribosyltransferase